MDNWYLVEFVAVMILATVLTRTAVLIIPRSYINSPLMQEFNRVFPAVILTLLIIYSVKGAKWDPSRIFSNEFAYGEIIGIAVTGIVHVWGRRNTLLSITAGTGAYVLWQYWAVV